MITSLVIFFLNSDNQPEKKIEKKPVKTLKPLPIETKKIQASKDLSPRAIKVKPEKKTIYKTKLTTKKQEEFKQKYINFLGEDYTIKLEPQKGYIKRIDNKKVYLEEIKVVMFSPKKKRSSFIALVNSKSGKILKTWGQVRKEGMLLKFNKAKIIKPSGSL